MQTEQSLTTGNTNILNPRMSLNKAFLKVKTNRNDSISLEAEIDRLVYELYG